MSRDKTTADPRQSADLRQRAERHRGAATMLVNPEELLKVFEESAHTQQILKEEIEALTHVGRQGELEQANVGLAAENLRLQEENEKLRMLRDANEACVRREIVENRKLQQTVKDFRAALEKYKNKACSVQSLDMAVNEALAKHPEET